MVNLKACQWEDRESSYGVGFRIHYKHDVWYNPDGTNIDTFYAECRTCFVTVLYTTQINNGWYVKSIDASPW